MSHPHSNTAISLDEQALSALARALTLPRQRFSLIIARCTAGNRCADVQHQVLTALRQRYAIDVETLTVEKTATNLYDEIQAFHSHSGRSPLWVTGLETVDALDELLSSANRMRDKFRQSFAFPLVLWADDEVLNQLIRLAPDFYSWASTPLVFGNRFPDTQNGSSLLEI